MALDNYDPSTALTAYYPTRAERRPARLWATEKLLHDMAELGMVEFFEGPGTDPTGIDGYDIGKLWLRVSSGVTEEPGEVRGYAGSGDPTLLASWPLLTPAGALAYFGASVPGTSIVSAASYAAMRDLLDLEPGVDIPDYDEVVLRVSDYTALKALPTTGAVIVTDPTRGGTFVWRSGNYASQVSSDPGEGRYVPSASDATGSTGCWVRHYTGAVRPQWYGAAGDGTTDDTTPIQHWLNYASSFLSPEVHLPAGQYRITSPLTIGGSGRVSIRGDGRGKSRLIFEITTGTALKWTVDGSHSYIKGVRFQGPGTEHEVNGIELYDDSSANVFYIFEDILVREFGNYGMIFSDSYNCSLRDSIVEYCGVRGTLEEAGADGRGGGVLLKRINFTGAATTGNDWRNCYFRNCHYGVIVEKGVSQSKALNTAFSNCIFEHNYAGMNLRNTGAGTLGRYQWLETCYFERNLYVGALLDEGAEFSCYTYITTPSTGTHAVGPDGIAFAGRSVSDRPEMFVVRNNLTSQTSRSIAFRIQKETANPRVDRLLVDRAEGIALVSTNGVPRNEEVKILAGSGTPEGQITAVVGSIFLRANGGAGTTLYVKESGTGNTGWVAK